MLSAPSRKQGTQITRTGAALVCATHYRRLRRVALALGRLGKSRNYKTELPVLLSHAPMLMIASSVSCVGSHEAPLSGIHLTASHGNLSFPILEREQ